MATGFNISAEMLKLLQQEAARDMMLQQQLNQLTAQPLPQYTIVTTSTSTWPNTNMYTSIPTGQFNYQLPPAVPGFLSPTPVTRADAARRGVQKDVTYDPFKPLYLHSDKFNTYLAIRNVKLRLV